MSVIEGWDTGIGAAIQSLKPGAEYSISGEGVYSEIVWLEKPVYEGGQAKPTEDEINAEIARLNTLYAQKEYQRKRKPEYPDIGEQLDALYHAIDADSDLKGKFSTFHTAVKTIKDKYPKP